MPGELWRGELTYRPDVHVPPNATAWPLIRRWLLTGVVVVLFVAAAAILVAAIGEATTAEGWILAWLAAAIPVVIVVPVFLWVDRLESEPPRLLLFAFLWGALVSTAGALILNSIGMQFFAGLQLDPAVTGAVFVAPVVEEVLKCLGVVLIFLVARREFNGVTDGLAYAGLVAAGFAFVENLLYLGRAYTIAGGPAVWEVFVLRGLLSPFAHPMFTICFGLALGLVAHRRRSVAALVFPAVGLAGAIGLHALWNLSAVQSMDTFFSLYVVLQVPLFLGFLALVVWARWREGRMMRHHLQGYGLGGWFTPGEVQMIASPRQRRRARAWARQVGGQRAGQAMTAFQDEAIALAVVRKHLQRGDDDLIWRQREARLLQRLPAHRAAFNPGPMPAPRRQL